MVIVDLLMLRARSRVVVIVQSHVVQVGGCLERGPRGRGHVLPGPPKGGRGVVVSGDRRPVHSSSSDVLDAAEEMRQQQGRQGRRRKESVNKQQTNAKKSVESRGNNNARVGPCGRFEIECCVVGWAFVLEKKRNVRVQPLAIVSANGRPGGADLLGGDVTDTRTLFSVPSFLSFYSLILFQLRLGFLIPLSVRERVLCVHLFFMIRRWRGGRGNAKEEGVVGGWIRRGSFLSTHARRPFSVSSPTSIFGFSFIYLFYNIAFHLLFKIIITVYFLTNKNMHFHL